MISEKEKEKIINKLNWITEKKIRGYIQLNAINGKIKTITKHYTEPLDDTQ